MPDKKQHSTFDEEDSTTSEDISAESKPQFAVGDV